ncbi:MAG: TerC/Alx family metal homeostasis membrane protein [Bacteroidales bacterium]|jgi:tellurite resistance protein TerC|nr:TerC/Alx family metal homeostasis membrane protein [Bacteroidales bacterium]
MDSSLFEILFFAGFTILIAGILIFDLGVLEKEDKVVTMKMAARSTAVWVFLALLFCLFIFFHGEKIHGVSTFDELKTISGKYHNNVDFGSLSFEEALKDYRSQMSIEYLTGYLIEYSLSIDNIFVMILIFASFGIERKFYKRVLMWGVLGAIIMRFIFIFLSSALIQKYEWILYIFGVFLVYTGIKMFVERNKKEEVKTTNNPIVRILSKVIPISHNTNDHTFFKRENGKLFMTILFVCLLVIEFTDLIFAVDSIPAIFSVTKDPFVVFFSNIFAILGLRSLFFLVSNVMNMFRFLKIGLSVLLTFIGVKMLAAHFLHSIGFQTYHSLIIILGILAISILASILIPEKSKTDL